MMARIGCQRTKNVSQELDTISELNADILLPDCIDRECHTARLFGPTFGNDSPLRRAIGNPGILWLMLELGKQDRYREGLYSL